MNAPATSALPPSLAVVCRERQDAEAAMVTIVPQNIAAYLLGFVFMGNNRYVWGMYKLITILSLLVFSSLLSAELYRWTDESGNVHFSDKPLSDQSELYVPPPIQTVPAGSTGSFTPRAKEAKFKYESISITSPANDAVFTPDTKSITVSIQIVPRLNTKESHTVALYLDGQLHNKGTGLSYSFADLPRGMHTVFAVIQDAKGKKLKTSDFISFNVQRHHL